MFLFVLFDQDLKILIILLFRIRNKNYIFFFSNWCFMCPQKIFMTSEMSKSSTMKFVFCFNFSNPFGYIKLSSCLSESVLIIRLLLSWNWCFWQTLESKFLFQNNFFWKDFYKCCEVRGTLIGKVSDESWINIKK